MATYENHRDEKVIKFTKSQEDRFLLSVDNCIQLGVEFVISMAKKAEETATEINKLFKNHGVEIVITADSEPKAVDYFINAMVGGAIGATAGTVAGAALLAGFHAWKAHVAADLVIPGIGQCIGIPAALGAIFGAIAGAASTHYGLRIQFSPTNNRNIDIELIREAA